MGGGDCYSSEWSSCLQMFGIVDEKDEGLNKNILKN